MYTLVVQHAGHAGNPVELRCLHWLVCMTDADTATLIQPPPSIAIEEMTGKSIRFIDGDKRETIVALHKLQTHQRFAFDRRPQSYHQPGRTGDERSLLVGVV